MGNPFERKFRTFAQQLDAKNATEHADAVANKSGEVFRDKPFTEEYRPLYRVAMIGQSLSQIVTFLTTAALGVFALNHIIPLWWGVYVAVPLGIAFAFGVERVKRSSLTIASKHLLKYRTFGFVGIVAALVMCVSIAAALYGAKELPGVVYPVPKRALDSDGAAQLTAEIERIQTDIDRLQNDLKSRRNWIAENRTLPRLQKERAALVERRETVRNSAEGRADADHRAALEDRAAQVEKMQVYSIGAAIVAELIFLFCTAFILYYLFRHFAERNTPEKEPTGAQSNGIGFYQNGTTTAANSLPQNETRQPIGFTYGKRITENVAGNERTCTHCGKAYVYGHARQKYCSDDCRIAAWENRTGTTLTKKAKS